MKRTASQLKARREERRALERAILRTLRNAHVGGSPAGTLDSLVVVVLVGLERARRSL